MLRLPRCRPDEDVVEVEDPVELASEGVGLGYARVVGKKSVFEEEFEFDTVG